MKRILWAMLAIAIGACLQFRYGGSGGWSSAYALEALLQWLRGNQ
jgi:hypothetical protein